MPDSPLPTNSLLLPLYEALTADDDLLGETKGVGLKLARRLKSLEWLSITQVKLCPKMSQENVSRAIKRLIEAGYIERRRSKNDQRNCQYRVAPKFRPPSPLHAASVRQLGPKGRLTIKRVRLGMKTFKSKDDRAKP